MDIENGFDDINEDLIKNSKEKKLDLRVKNKKN